MSSRQRPTRKTQTLRGAIKARFSEMLSFARIKSTSKERGEIVYRAMKQNKMQNFHVDPNSAAVKDCVAAIFIALDKN